MKGSSELRRPTSRLALGLGVVGVLAVLTAIFFANLRHPSEKRLRELRIREQDAAISDADLQRYLERSDEVSARLEDQGVEEIGSYVLTRMRQVTVSEDQRRAWYSAHQDVFGGRSYEESWATVDRLVRIDLARSELTALSR